MEKWTDCAITYWSLGYNPIPCGIESKRSICEWGEYQERRISFEEILNYGKNNPLANLALITGEISYLVVVDVDGPEGQEFLIQLKGFPSNLPTVRTWRGCHYYFRYPDFKISTMSDTGLKIDLRSDGAYVLAPPSIHPYGDHYEWEPPYKYEWPSIEDLPELPRSLIKHFENQGKISKSGENALLENIESSNSDWKRAKKEIKKHSSIIEWLKTPKPDDRSGHDWSLAMLCIEHGVSEEALLYQILLHNDHGKANSRKKDQEKYINKLIHRAKSEYKQPALFISAHDLSKMEFTESHSLIGKGVLSPGMGLILAVEGEVGKSLATYELALRLVSGQPFMGLTTVKINGALIIQSENILPMTQERLKKQQLGMKLSNLPNNVFFSNPNDSCLSGRHE